MFPDIANVEFIRSALWRHKAIGNASVMIGAGFSRNGDPASSSARSMPNWSEMATALCEPLYPSDPARLAAAKLEASGTSGFLRLAQEYQSAFGRSALSTKIRDLVPDLEHNPGDLHKRLLRLPWSDVFSTNWDTLIERGCADVFERSYDVVRTIQQIPNAVRPRIVKLHGTLPAHEPFIFTEEDYRTFPQNFAALVNLVQQSMMETTFCLLGFSGDDPNFLHWSGWVRDNLGGSAPKIYLVGWLELSVHRRRMLEERSVMPVDLAALPQATAWPREFRHRYASEWFIRALEMGKPYDISVWPTAGPPSDSPPAHLAPLPSAVTTTPQKEPFAPAFGAELDQRLSALRDILPIWAHNRKLYPGWVIAPEHVRRGLWDRTVPWLGEIVSLLADLSPMERLQALIEIVWRFNKCLFPLPPELEDGAREVLGSVDRAAMKVGGAALTDATKWPDLLRGLQELALALSRNARHAGDLLRFEEALAFLEDFASHSVDARHAITYERCLWSVATGDLLQLKSMLDDWSPDDREAIWLLRKAGLLAEMREDARACNTLELALTNIRRNRRRDIDDIVSLSNESWALFLALAYSGNRSFNSGPELKDDAPEPFQRWRELATVECDANSEYRALVSVLEIGRQPERLVTRQKHFDADREGITYHLGGGGLPRSVIAAYQMILLAEETGIPAATNHLILFREGLSAATKIIAPDEPWLACQLAIRAESGSDKVIDDVFSRTRIAAFPSSLILLLRDNMLKRTAYALAILGSSGTIVQDWISICSDSIEVLSRVALRLSPTQLNILFSEIVGYYRSPIMRKRSIFLGESLGHLLTRILESLPDDDIERLLPDLFTLPLVHERGFEADEHRWLDPVAALPESFLPGKLADPPRDAVWTGIIARLSDLASDGDVPNREAAVLRLHKLWKWNLLSAAETELFASALWAPVHLDEDGLPSHTRYFRWAFLMLPVPANIDMPGTFARYLKRIAEQAVGDICDRLQVIGILIIESERLGIDLSIAPETREAFASLVDAWASKRFSSALLSLHGNQEARKELNALIGIKAVLPKIELSDELSERVWQKVNELDSQPDRAVRAYRLYSVLAYLYPDRATALVAQLQRALLSDFEDDARAAVNALYEWTLDAMREPDKFAMPDARLFREIGISISVRRAAILRTALEIARWLFDDGPKNYAASIADDCEFGLGALIEEAGYSRSDVSFDVPGVRAACVRLALAMSRAGFGLGPGVQAWIDAMADDPLPEVRHAATRRFVQ
jgi:hypothetical protein